MEPRKVFWLDSWTIAASVCVGILMAQCIAGLYSWTVTQIRERDKEAHARMTLYGAENQLILESIRIRAETERLKALVKPQSSPSRKTSGSLPVERLTPALLKKIESHIAKCSRPDPNFPEDLCWSPSDGTGPYGPFPTRENAIEYAKREARREID